MSTSLLYHAFGLRGYRYLRTEYLNGQVFFTVAMQPKKIRCPVCNCRKVIRRGTAERRFRSLPIGKKTVWIVLAIQRVWCSACSLVRQVRLDFTDSRRSYTRVFE
ncbi:MAG: transposase family protein, partial [Desulfosarcina sp.]